MSGAIPTIPLRPLASGHDIPAIGLGLWQNKDPRAVSLAVKAAYDAGYRHFDTAQIYGNERLLADAFIEHGIKRREVFITTKVSVFNLVGFRINRSFETSLKNLRTDHVDLVLIHFPVTGLRQAAWKHVQEWQASGRARSIGVSNYTVTHLRELLEAGGTHPDVNQVELHVFLQQPELLDFCRQQGIVVEAYSPLAHGFGLDNPVLQTIASRHQRTPAQVMIRWCIQQGTIPLPKSVTPERIKQNIQVFDFELTAADMSELAQLNQNKRTCWDPTHVP